MRKMKVFLPLLFFACLDFSVHVSRAYGVTKEDGAQLGEMGRTYMIEIGSPVRIESPDRNEGAVATIIFQYGQRQFRSFSDLDTSEPYCWLTVQYDTDAFLESLNTGKYPELLLKPSWFLLSQSSIYSDYAGPNRGFRVLAIAFDINPFFQDGIRVVSGQRLDRVDGKVGNSRAMALACEGNDLRVRDVSKAFGPAFLVHVR